ncbi:MAG: pyruvate dehydrogenase [Planctomycetes bacterium]|nr:pyruvate dehydrogenase [Planctomycetota bacterium]MCP4861947.1 pyruvate dehydrogenase [Planctomycetota bacterium]
MAKKNPTSTALPQEDVGTLNLIAERALAWTVRMIWDANNRKEKAHGDPKVGGHPASCASSLHLATALHLVAREGTDFYCAKPHLAPLDHALNRAKGFLRHPDGSWFNEQEGADVMSRLRDFSRDGKAVFQSYHADSDPDSWRTLPSGTVGIPPVNAAYLALAFRYSVDHGWSTDLPKHFWCIIGDSELREGSLMEAMPDVAERELGNVTWIVDYNRQNLDGTRIPNQRGLRGTDADRIQKTFEANGWDVLQLRHGSLREDLFAKKGGKAFRAALEDGLTDYELQAILAMQDADLARKYLAEAGVSKGFLDSVKDEVLLRAMADMGGHDMNVVLNAYAEARRDERVPTLIVAHTLKGWGLNCAAEPGNHSTIPEKEEIEELLKAQGLDWDQPYSMDGNWQKDGAERTFLNKRQEAFRTEVLAVEERIVSNRESAMAKLAEAGPLPEDFGLNLSMVPYAHTQWVWGQVAGKIVRIGTHDELKAAGLEAGNAPSESEKPWQRASEFALTMSPDVGTSTNINPAMDEKVYGPEVDTNLEAELGWSQRGRPELYEHSGAWTRHIRFEIAEANCMSAAGSFGQMGRFSGVPLLPLMTVYDFFIKRALDQLYYNVYWRSSFILVGTPSGVSLSPEGAQHSWKSDIQFPSLITWEPAFAKEMEWILADATRRHLEGDQVDREGVLVRASTRGLPQKDFKNRLKAQPRFAGQDMDAIHAAVREDVLAGGYKLIDRSNEQGYLPGDNVVTVLAMGALVPEALEASDSMLADGIFADVIVVTSADLLLGRFAERDGYAQLAALGVNGDLQLVPAGLADGAISTPEARALAGRFVPILAVCDGEAGLLDNAGSIVGVPQKTLCVDHFSKSGTPEDIYKYHNLDPASIAAGAQQILETTAARNVQIRG